MPVTKVERSPGPSPSWIGVTMGDWMLFVHQGGRAHFPGIVEVALEFPVGRIAELPPEHDATALARAMLAGGPPEPFIDYLLENATPLFRHALEIAMSGKE